VFVGIGPADAVDGYLASVERERVVDSAPTTALRNNSSPVGHPPRRRNSKRSGVASAAGPGTQQLTWTVAEGRWAAVVMNADGSRPVVADLSAGAMAPDLRWVWIGQYIGAGIGLSAGALLILLALRRHDRRERS
jgi:hypothetical protein